MEILAKRGNKMKMPVLFVGHGSPENIVLENKFTQSLAALGTELPKPETILVISAHWLTNGTYVTGAGRPEQIYDFYGFPQELYNVRYPSPGSILGAKTVKETVKNSQIKIDPERGLDHAAWAVLKHMYPAADIPVIEMSLDYSPNNGWNKPTLQYYYNLAKELCPLREAGFLIIGSGNIVHNLRLVDMVNMDAKPYPWAIEFDELIKRALNERNHTKLMDCQNINQSTALSIPTLDHYLPMIFAASLQEKKDELEYFYEGFQNRSVSMRCFKVG